MSLGDMPTLIGLPGVLVTRLIGVTVLKPTTYAVLLSGVMAIGTGHTPLPALIALPGVLVARLIGVTVRYSPRGSGRKRELSTYAVLPSGAIAIALSPLPTLIVLPGVLVAVSIGTTPRSVMT